MTPAVENDFTDMEKNSSVTLTEVVLQGLLKCEKSP
jgi:hypothetical protein